MDPLGSKPTRELDAHDVRALADLIQRERAAARAGALEEAAVALAKQQDDWQKLAAAAADWAPVHDFRSRVALVLGDQVRLIRGMARASLPSTGTRDGGAKP